MRCQRLLRNTDIGNFRLTECALSRIEGAGDFGAGQLHGARRLNVRSDEGHAVGVHAARHVYAEDGRSTFIQFFYSLSEFSLERS